MRARADGEPYQRYDDQKQRKCEHQVGRPPPAQNDRRTGDQRHRPLADRDARGREAERRTSTLAEPVRDDERGGHDARRRSPRAEQKIGSEQRRQRVGTACRGERDADGRRAESYNDARINAIEQPSNERHAHAVRDRKRGGKERELRAAPAIILMQRMEENPDDVVPDSPYDGERHEQTRDQQPPSNFFLAHGFSPLLDDLPSGIAAGLTSREIPLSDNWPSPCHKRGARSNAWFERVILKIARF